MKWKKAFLAILLSAALLAGEALPVYGALAETGAEETVVETPAPSPTDAPVEASPKASEPAQIEQPRSTEPATDPQPQEPQPTQALSSDPAATQPAPSLAPETSLTPAPGGEPQPTEAVRIEKIAFTKAEVEITLAEYARGLDFGKLNNIEITPENAVRESAVWSVRKGKDGPLDSSVAAFVDYDKDGEKLEGEYSEEEVEETRFEVYQAGEVYIRAALKSNPSIYGEFKLVIRENPPAGEAPSGEEGDGQPAGGELPQEGGLLEENLLPQNELGPEGGEAQGGAPENPQPTKELLTEELIPQIDLTSQGDSDLVPVGQMPALLSLGAPMSNGLEPIAVSPSSLAVYVGDDVSWMVSLQEALFADSEIPSPAINGTSIALKGDESGYEAVAPGVTTVTYVKLDLNNEPQSATITILVSAAPAETIELSKSEIYLNAGETASLSHALDTRVEGAQVSYTSNAPQVATVTEAGEVTAVAAGTATITATFTDWNHVEKRATCEVTVGVYPTGLTFSEDVEDSYLLAVGGEQALSAVAAFPEGTPEGTQAEILWRSADEAVATVDASGKVTAVGAGETKIIASTKNGHETDVTVVVGTIEIDRPEGPNMLLIGETVALESVVAPESLPVVWHTSDAAVAAVDENGRVTALKSGSVTITAYASEVGSPVFQQLALTVSPLRPAEGLARSVVLAKGGEAKQLSLQALPEEFAGATTRWLSSNPDVADVTEAGLVSPVCAGAATVSAIVSFQETTCELDFEITVVAVELSAEGEVASVARGETLQLLGETSPDEYALAWSSSDATRAAVDQNGLVTGVAAGEVTITAAATVEGVEAKAEYALTVTVPATAIAVSGAQFDPQNKVELYSGETLSLTLEPTPEDTTDAGEWLWEETLGVKVELSEDKKTATVSAEVGEDGAMLLEDGEEFLLTAKAGTVEEKRTVVFRQAVSIVEITGEKVEIDEETNARSLRLYTTADSNGFGPTAQLSAELLPAGAAATDVAWSSSNEEVVRVDSASGLATAVAYGSATIRATAENGVFGEISVVVRNRAEYITLDPTYIKIDRYDGDVPHKINARTYPEGADELFWSSSDEAVATVDQEGNVTCRGTGIAVIRARTSDTDLKAPDAIALVHVVQHVNEIRLHTDPFPDINDIGLTVAVKQIVTLGVTLLPEGATDLNYTMVAEDPSILTVAGNRMMGKKAGTTSVIITASDASDGKTRTRTIPVRVVAKGKGVTSLKLSKSSISIYDGQSYRVKASVSSKASVKGVRYYSENEEICIVNPANGTVTGTGIGETYIHCIASSGLVKSCKVTVKPQKATSVRFTNASNGTMRVGETYQLQAECLPSTITYEEDKIIANWVTSNPSVAIVNDEGFLYCVSAGTTYVYAQATSGKYARIKLTVKNQTAAGVNLINTSTNPGGVLYVGGVYRMQSELFLGNPLNGGYERIDDGDYVYDAVYYGYGTNPDFGVDIDILLANTKNSAVVWGSSNKKIAQVDYNTGVITCLRSGTFDLLCAAASNTKKIYRLRLTVTVPPSYDYVNALTLLDEETGQKATSVTMTYGDPENNTHKLSYSLDYPDALQAEWFSEDERVATVDQNGLITATGIGETTVAILVGGFDYREVPVRVTREDGTSDVTYRNLTITMYQTPGQRGYLAFMKNSGALIRSAIAGQDVDGARYDMAYRTNAQVTKKSHFASAIESTFKDTKEGDVSVIVLMSHGTIKNNQYRWHLSGTSNYKLSYISGTEIVNTIKQYVRGHVVVVLLSCYSGASTPASSLGAQIRALDASLSGGNSVSLITSTDGNSQSGYFNTSAYIAYDFFSVGVASTIANNSELTIAEFGSLTKSNTAAFLAEHKAIYGSSSIGMNHNPIVQLYISDRAKDVVVF